MERFGGFFLRNIGHHELNFKLTRISGCIVRALRHCLPVLSLNRNNFGTTTVLTIPDDGAAGVTEELKACDPMRWVGLMNTLKAQAEEIVLTELIYQ